MTSSGGRLHFGMVAGIKSERWPTSNRNPRPDCLGIRRYVADFYCHAAKLVVELDGKQHEWFSDYDKGRTEVLQGFGVRVIRFTNDNVYEDIDAVLARIRAELRIPSD